MTAVHKGDGRLFGSISGVRTSRVVATAKPAIASIVDVKGDQGKQVRLRFRASPYDYLGSAMPITKYDVFRRTNPALAAFAARSTAAAARPAGALVDGWDFVATRADTGYVDAGAAGGYYKLSAVDVNGNESAYALLAPSGTLDVAGDASLAFALDGVRPNPTRGRSLSVSLSLPVAGDAHLQLLDVGGRQVTTREVGSLGAGRHTVTLDAGRRLAPGLYLVRLTQGANESVTRAVVTD